LTQAGGPSAGTQPVPPRYRRDTVARRTVMVAVAAAAITAIVALLVSLPVLVNAATRESRAQLSELADITAATLEDPRPGSAARLRSLLSSRGIQAYAVLPDAAPPAGVPQDVVDELLSGEDVSERLQVDGELVLLEGRAVLDGGILLTEPVAVVTTAWESLSLLLVPLALGIAAAVGGAVFAARRVTAPLRRVAEGAEQLAAGQRDVRVDADRPEEVAEIADAVNRLSEALTQSEGRQREFLLSVSHELRTPLTAISGYAEALADGVVAGDSVARTGEVMVLESQRLERLVSDLLDLSRLGAANFQVQEQPVDLRVLLEEAGEVWRDRCRRAGVGLSLAVARDGSATVVTDPVRVRQIIDNLAENALRVVPEQGTIVLALTTGPGTVALQIRDSGPGLTPQDIEDAFQPGVLYSRYRGIRPVSTGVGLALVGRLAERLGARATAGSADEGGAQFTVTFPLEGTAGPSTPPQARASDPM